MKIIQWYPGHMAKAVRMMQENLKLCDAVIIVLDARAPVSSYNPKLKELAGNKPVLYVLNKGDLSDGGADGLLAAMRSQGMRAVKCAATFLVSARPLISAMQETASERAARLAQKGSARPLRFLVAGIPNTGKSTLINLLSGGKKAQTGDKAGVTRTKQWVKCGSFELLDTPGTMPPSCENQVFARRLAALGCINDDILEFDEIALFLLGELREKYPSALAERYGVTDGEPLELLKQICVKRGLILRGGECDYERGERMLIDEFRKGKLGKVCLDGLSDLA